MDPCRTVPRTGDEWLSTRPVEEQREEYRRRAAADVAEARAGAAGRPRLVGWYLEQAASQRARWGEPPEYHGSG